MPIKSHSLCNRHNLQKLSTTSATTTIPAKTKISKTKTKTNRWWCWVSPCRCHSKSCCCCCCCCCFCCRFFCWPMSSKSSVQIWLNSWKLWLLLLLLWQINAVGLLAGNWLEVRLVSSFYKRRDGGNLLGLLRVGHFMLLLLQISLL